MKIRKYLQYALILFLLQASSISLLAQQVTIDNNFMSLLSNNLMNTGTSISMTVPTGTNKILLVGVAQSDGNITSMDFGGQPMTLFMQQTSNAIFSSPAEYSYYYLVLGDVTTAMTANINITTTAIDTRLEFAVSLNDVNQANPLDGYVSTSGIGSPTTLSLNVPSSINDLVLDFMVTVSSLNTFTVGTGQNSIGDISELPNFFRGNISVKNGIDTTTPMTQTSSAFFGAFYSALAIKAHIPTPSTPIPTMSQWGLLLFGLLIMNLSVFFVHKQQNAID